MKLRKQQFNSVFFAFVLIMFGVLSTGNVSSVFAQGGIAVIESTLENQLTREDLQAMNGNDVQIFEHDGRVTFVAGKCTEEPVRSMDDAGNVIVSMITLLGGDLKTQFIPWRNLTDANGNKYFVFEQLYAGTTVVGGAVKVITDPDGNMIGFSSSIETELPEVAESIGITAEEAERIVIKHAEESGQPVPNVIEGLTDKMILPTILSIDVDAEENPSRFVWVVYTDNPESPVNRNSELPYLAHYVTMNGEYLYSLETIMPGDTAGSTGFDTEYVFLHMEPAEYTGYVDLSDGTEMEVTVNVMRDKYTGMYYLGDIERKIVVAKCYDFLYNGGKVVLESSPDNLAWDQVGLLSLYNYSRAYDYYKAIGWIGGDGLGTPIMILNDFQDENHVQVDNAAFVGNYLGWSLFLSSYANDFSQCLDVIAHEFTHCVTDAVMTYNSYLNDFGAINEGMSDIQGKICEMMADGKENVSWLIGDKSKTAIRSLEKPRLYSQPEFSWDLYYVPNVKTPTETNDRGGVHTNSSLLSTVAYRLIEKGGMSLEDARAFWFAVDCTMVPGTDYPQLRELLPWVLKSQGMDQYQTALQQALDAVRLGNAELPDFFDSDRALVKLELPDNENFTDGKWVMMYGSVDVHGFADKISSLFELISSGDYSTLPQTIQNLLAQPTETPVPSYEDSYGFSGGGFWDDLLKLFTEPELIYGVQTPTPTPTPVPSELSAEESREINTWLHEEFADVLFSTMSFAGQDGRTIQMMAIPGRTIPLLMYMSLNGESMSLDHFMPVVYMNNHWYELPDLAPMLNADPDSEEQQLSALDDEKISLLVNDTMTKIMDNFGSIKNLDDALDLVSFTIKGGEVNVIPSDGLETIVIPEAQESVVIPLSSGENIPPRMSRPKVIEEPTPTPEPEMI